MKKYALTFVVETDDDSLIDGPSILLRALQSIDLYNTGDRRDDIAAVTAAAVEEV